MGSTLGLTDRLLLTADPRKRTGSGQWRLDEAGTLDLIEQAGFADPVVHYRRVWVVDNRIVGCTRASVVTGSTP